MNFHKSVMGVLTVTSAGLVFTVVIGLAADWPAFRGPNGDGVVSENLALRPWPADGLKVLWKVPVATGFSSFSVADGKAFTLERRPFDGADHESCVARDAASGRELWAVKLSVAKYDGGGDSGGGGDGPRSTPVFNSGRVYVFDSRLVLTRLDAGSGAVVWRKDLLAEHGGKALKWQSAASPVIDGDLVFVAGGGAGQALLGINKNSGVAVWKTQRDVATHATPVVADLGGVRQVIFLTHEGLVGLAVKDGHVLWRFPFPFRTSTAASPVVAGDVVFCTAGYGVGGAACRIVKSTAGLMAEELWRIPGDKEVASLWGTPVQHAGHLYGMMSFKQYNSGPLKCVELATGKVKWAQPGFGAGQVVLVRDKLLALTDDGRVVLVEASPAGYRELARCKVLQGKCWSTPALADGRLYIRSTREGACLDLGTR